jgi:lipoyl-dependent peroxiredoxin
MKVLYTAEALATGDGRNGHARTTDGKVDVALSIPKEMGGDGSAGTNPEQLFAAGYAACFHSALRLVGKQAKANIDDSAVGAKVGIGPNDAGGFQLEVTLEVSLPNVSREEAQALADAAHQVCPYSNATRGNIDVEVLVPEPGPGEVRIATALAPIHNHDLAIVRGVEAAATGVLRLEVETTYPLESAADAAAATERPGS